VSSRALGRAIAVPLVGCAVTLLPLARPSFFVPDPRRSVLVSVAGAWIAMLAPAAAVWLLWRCLPELGGARARVRLILLFGLTAALLTEIHRTTVDQSIYLGQHVPNTEWQRTLQESVLARDPAAIPHTYRPLPHAFLAWLELLSGSFPFASWVYRMTFLWLLLGWIYGFARLHVRPAAAILATFLYCAIYPITIRYYAGQPADPMSHLSFVLAFYALGTGAFPLFVAAVAIGCLAKESVVALVGFYALFGRRDPAFARRLVLVAAISSVALIAPRLAVPHTPSGYAAVSGVGLDHVRTNLANYEHWAPQLLFTIGILAPFALWGWRDANPLLRRLTLFLLPTLFLSSLLFSWLREARNFVPLVVPLAIMAAQQIVAEAEERA
jgi:hypothetical protein